MLIQAGGDISIRATGGGADSDLTLRGSTVQAGGKTRLPAEDQIKILAAQNTTQESNSQSSQSGSIGVGINLGAGGLKAGVTVSASAGKGQGAGNSSTYSNSQIAGSQVTLQSGGDTTIKGGVVQGEQVTAQVGGKLTIESLQDKSQYKEKSQQVGGSVTIGPSPGGSLSAGQTKINSDYLSVGEQSAIRAGDGGFDVQVAGKTELTGAQITSTQAAIDSGKNRYEAQGGTTVKDLQNSASYEAKSVSVGLGAGTPAPGKSLSAGLSGVGLGSDSGSASSTSTAGISGVTGNTAARTGDKEAGLKPIFDKDKARQEVNAQVAITSEFGKQASKEIGNEFGKKAAALKAEAGKLAEGDPQRQALLNEAAKYDEGGAYRVAAHAVVGGLTGGVQGAVGAGAASASAPTLNDLQRQLEAGLQKAGLGEGASQVIASLAGGATAATIGAAASGGSTAGAATAFNADMNNRQLHPTEIQWIKDNASRYAAQKRISRDEAEKQLAEQAFRQVQFGAEGGAPAWDAEAQAFLKSAGTQALPNGGYLFYATPEQRADATMYLDSAVENADFYAKNGLKQPTQAELLVAARRDADIRANLKAATKTAFAASAALDLAALAPTALRWALANPIAANTAGIITAETAAAITSGAVTPSSLAPMLSSGGMKAVTTMGEAVSGQAAKATAGGYINAAKVCESGCAITGLTASEQALVLEIQAGKDKGGQLTEQLLSAVATRTGSTVLSGGKYGSNNGFDVVLKNADGTVTVVVDGKQMLQSRAFSLTSNAAGGNTQNSAAWVDAVLERLDKSSAAYKAVEAAAKSNTLVTAVGGVNRTTGQLVVLPVTLPGK